MADKDKAAETKAVPRFVLYGERLDEWRGWFVNIEHLADRCADRGWRIEPHAHPGFGQIMFLRSGGGTMLVDDRRLSFASPCIIVLPKHTVHGFQYHDDCDGWVLTIEASYLSQILDKLPEFSRLWSEPQLIPLDRSGDLWGDVYTQLKALDREIERRDLGHILAAEMTLTSLFLSLVRSRNASTAQPVAVVETRLINQFNELIERYFRQGWKVKDYADVLGVSVTQLRAACMDAVGKSPLKLVHDR
ncbi:MAG: AraC family ligand binding domain-containing protein, partial [Pseudomonadota bacterium]